MGIKQEDYELGDYKIHIESFTATEGLEIMKTLLGLLLSVLPAISKPGEESDLKLSDLDVSKIKDIFLSSNNGGIDIVSLAKKLVSKCTIEGKGSLKEEDLFDSVFAGEYDLLFELATEVCNFNGFFSVLNKLNKNKK